MNGIEITPDERHYYVREKQFQITPEDVRSWLMEATRDRRKTTYELNFRIHRLGTALKSVQKKSVELEAENVKLQKMVDWLADHLYTAVSCPRGDTELQCPFGTQPSAEDCENHHWLKCWKEAARRAVGCGR